MDIFEASLKGNLERVKELLDVDRRDPEYYGSTPLMYAAQQGRLETVKFLVGKGANIELKNKVGRVPLMFASQNGHLEIVKFLVEKGADLNQRDEEYTSTPLMFASQNGYLEIVKFLVEKGADLNNDGYTALMYASLNGHLEIVKFLVEKGADVNIKMNGYTALGLSLSDFPKNIEIAKFLLDNGANPFDVKCEKKECEDFLLPYIWKRLYKRDIETAGRFANSGDIPLPKDLWELILLNKRQKQLCQNLNSENNKAILIFFAEELGIPIDKTITKAQLCGVIATQLAYGKHYSEKGAKLLDEKRKKEIKLIKQTAQRFGLDVDRPLKEILEDLSKTLL